MNFNLFQLLISQNMLYEMVILHIIYINFLTPGITWNLNFLLDYFVNN